MADEASSINEALKHDIERAKENHIPEERGPDGDDWTACALCDVEWPCDAIFFAKKTEALEARVTALTKTLEGLIAGADEVGDWPDQCANCQQASVSAGMATECPWHLAKTHARAILHQPEGEGT